MSSSNMDIDNDNIRENVAYKPGIFRYQDLPTNKRKKLFEDRQKELNPCYKVRNFTWLTNRLILLGINRINVELFSKSYFVFRM